MPEMIQIAVQQIFYIVRDIYW